MKLGLFYNLPTGGKKRIFLQMANELIKKGHNVTLYSNYHGHRKKLFNTKIKTHNIFKLKWLTSISTKQYLNLIYFKYFNYA